MVSGLIVEFGLNKLVIVWFWCLCGVVLLRLLGLNDGLFIIVNILFVFIFMIIVEFEVVLYVSIVDFIVL